MYPKNNASPLRIAVGSVVQISDGAVQTTGCSVVVRAQGGSESAGSGTLECGGTSSIWYYTPTQGETNYTAFCVTVYKSGCIPATVTVVTTDTSTAGRVNVALIDNVSATKLASAITTVTTGTVTAGATTTSIPTSSLSPSASVTDQFKGLILKFRDDTTTAALRGQGTDITASTSGGTLTVTALTTAPASGDTFTIQ